MQTKPHQLVDKVWSAPAGSVRGSGLGEQQGRACASHSKPRGPRAGAEAWLSPDAPGAASVLWSHPGGAAAVLTGHPPTKRFERASSWESQASAPRGGLWPRGGHGGPKQESQAATPGCCTQGSAAVPGTKPHPGKHCCVQAASASALPEGPTRGHPASSGPFFTCLAAPSPAGAAGVPHPTIPTTASPFFPNYNGLGELVPLALSLWAARLSLGPQSLRRAAAYPSCWAQTCCQEPTSSPGVCPAPLTPFFPGMAHSQFIRFIVPSGFFVGTATKP